MRVKLIPGRHFHRYYRLPGGAVLVSRMTHNGYGIRETAWTWRAAFNERQIDLDSYPEKEMSQEEARVIFGDKWFPPVCSEVPGYDEDRLRKLADLGDEEALKCLKRLKYRNR